MIASTERTLGDLAEEIDVAFARWDRSHLHEFDFGEGRRLMLGGSDSEPDGL